MTTVMKAWCKHSTQSGWVSVEIKRANGRPGELIEVITVLLFYVGKKNEKINKLNMRISKLLAFTMRRRGGALNLPS